jgi:hypothetical protein
MALTVKSQAWSHNPSGKSDYIPDPDAIHEVVDKKARRLISYRVSWNPKLHTDANGNVMGGYERVMIDIKSVADIEKEKKMITLNDEQRTAMAIKTAESMGIKLTPEVIENLKPKDPKIPEGTDPKLVCRCGYIGKDKNDIFKHKSGCTFMINAVRTLTS